MKVQKVTLRFKIMKKSKIVQVGFFLIPLLVFIGFSVRDSLIRTEDVLMPKVVKSDLVGLWKYDDETLLLKEDGFFEYHGANVNLRFSIEEKEIFRWDTNDWNLYLTAKAGGNKSRSKSIYFQGERIEADKTPYYIWHVIKYKGEFRILDNYQGIDTFSTWDFRFKKVE